MFFRVDLPRHWHKPLMATLFVIFSSLLFFHATWASMEAIWDRSETFTHGYLVAPISLWLIWQNRHQYRDLAPRFSALGSLAILVFGLVWLVADLVQVLVIRQWAVVGVLIAGIWSVLGSRVSTAILFPLLFLFLMVPFGEEFIPWLMDYTASFVVGMLRLTGISVYREGTFFTLTSGQWSVVEGCSGLRYLIASFTLGTVYAYLNYSRFYKRAVFFLAAFLMPILANGLRAYMIVMIGHLSNMKLATGVDHIIYGWVFFGLVMLLLFYLGSFWQDPPLHIEANSVEAQDETHSDPYRWPVLMLTLICLGVWPLLANELHARQAVQATIPVRLLSPSLGEAVSPPAWNWQPEFKGVMADARVFVHEANVVMAMYVANFGDETGGGELVNSQNVLVKQKHEVWRMLSAMPIPVDFAEGRVDVEESVLNSTQGDLLVWRWYRIGDEQTSNTYRAKWLQLLKRLTGDASPELMVVLYTETTHDEHSQARAALQSLALACCSHD